MVDLMAEQKDNVMVANWVVWRDDSSADKLEILKVGC
jgi:hypothetical protein